MQSSAGSLCHLCAAELQPQLWDCSRGCVLRAVAVAGQGIQCYMLQLVMVLEIQSRAGNSVLHATASDGCCRFNQLCRNATGASEGPQLGIMENARIEVVMGSQV